MISQRNIVCNMEENTLTIYPILRFVDCLIKSIFIVMCTLCNFGICQLHPPDVPAPFPRPLELSEGDGSDVSLVGVGGRAIHGELEWERGRLIAQLPKFQTF